MKGNKMGVWDVIERVFRVVEFLIIVGGVIFTVIQVNDITNNAAHRENDLLLRYEDRINSGTNRIISSAIENKEPILTNNKFTTADLDNYLGAIEDIDYAYNKNLLTDDDIYEYFSDTIVNAYKNEEIQQYLKTIRIKDEKYFQGFTEIGIHETETN